MGADFVFSKIERPVGYALGGILIPAFAGGGNILATGHIGVEGDKVKEVRGGLDKLNLQGVIVQRLYANVVAGAGAGEVFTRTLYIIVYKERIGGRKLGGAGALPCVFKVMGGNALAVGPLCILAQLEGVNGVLHALCVRA